MDERVDNHIDFIGLLTEAWAVFRAHAMQFAVATLIVIVLQSAMNYFYIAGILLTGPMIMGLFKMGLSGTRKLEVRLADVFAGFDFFVTAVLMNLGVVVVALLGVAVHGFPRFLLFGVFLPAYSVLVLPAYFFLLDGTPGLMEALTQTRAMVQRDFRAWMFTAVYVFALFMLGVVLAGIGLVVTVPLIIISLARLYDRYKRGLSLSGAGSSGETP